MMLQHNLLKSRYPGRQRRFYNTINFTFYKNAYFGYFINHTFTPKLFAMMKPLHFLPWMILLLLLTVAQKGNTQSALPSIPLTTTFTTQDYQGGIQNWDITQDHRGFIYVANNFGLLEFDGTQWNNYIVPNSTRIRSLLADSSRIYIGGQGQLGYFEANTVGNLVFTSLKELIDDEDNNLDDIWNIYRYRNEIVFCSIDKLLFYNGTAIRVLRPDTSLGYTFCVDSQLFSYSITYGLLQLQGQELKPHPEGAFFAGKTIVAMLRDEEGHPLAVTREGDVVRIDTANISLLVAASELIPDLTVNTATRLADGTIALGTQNDGVLIVSETGETTRHLTNETGLKSRTVTSLYQDEFGNLWVGLNNGISYVELNSPFSFINEQAGIPGTGYAARSFQDYIYLGTNNGLYYWSPKGNQYQAVNNSSGQVYALAEVDSQLVLNHHRGAFTVEQDRAELFFGQTGTWYMRQVPGQATYICGTYEGFYLFKKHRGQFRMVQKVEGINESSRVFEFDAQNNLWMTHGYKGVYYLDFQRSLTEPEVSFFNHKDGFYSDILINVYPIDGQLLFPGEWGIYVYQPDTQTFGLDSTFNKLLEPYGHVSVMRQDDLGNIYFIADNQLGVLRKSSTGNYRVETDAFFRINKYLSDDLGNISIIDLEQVLIGAQEGFVMFNPLAQVFKPSHYLTYIRQVMTIGPTDSLVYGGGLTASTDTLSFAHHDNALRFTFAAPYFDGMQDTQYRYTLVGFDDGWSAYAAPTIKEYTNLPPGNYTFQVQARTIYGQEGECASFSFIVRSPWYATGEAYAGYSLLLLGLLLLGLKGIKKKHLREKDALQEEKHQALLRKEDEFKRAAQQSAEQIMRLENEKLESEITYKNKRLAGLSMHLLTKNKFIVDVKKELKHAVNCQKNLVTDVNKVIKSIDKNITLDDDWKEFEQHFDQVHGDFIKRLKATYPNLTTQETKLAAFLRVGMTTKEIANLLHNSVRSVEISRYRLRKKLQLDRETNLVDFMMNF